eukprot:CAMPEP_0174369202 /NCGR_PEP_ID=MMETSP0811_2-20130205/91654_1 /TAXON_ID=73025 ORGANISM="Eutreptiella gymnastica-like, Strain CCMP1594" /NCGR_SAMPLE_ID=MMETSP0811_2 /ASSEMBLY_ACC=CAM_ASM_000667 /LENGTH=199 /DNA_ID=CAMNT_0015513397 /DNA_START=300 /DNA_END=897 /DNA_ORIENTATION=-
MKSQLYYRFRRENSEGLLAVQTEILHSPVRSNVPTLFMRGAGVRVRVQWQTAQTLRMWGFFRRENWGLSWVQQGAGTADLKAFTLLADTGPGAIQRISLWGPRSGMGFWGRCTPPVAGGNADDPPARPRHRLMVRMRQTRALSIPQTAPAVGGRTRILEHVVIGQMLCKRDGSACAVGRAFLSLQSCSGVFPGSTTAAG